MYRADDRKNAVNGRELSNCRRKNDVTFGLDNSIQIVERLGAARMEAGLSMDKIRCKPPNVCKSTLTCVPAHDKERVCRFTCTFAYECGFSSRFERERTSAQVHRSEIGASEIKLINQQIN